MDSPEYQAYNLTRKCFLGNGFVIGDFSLANRKQWLARLNDGSGIWMKPFRGIHKGEAQVPIDLLYLDEGCRVLDAVESFPASCVSPSTPVAATVLALSVHSIEPSQTKPGDQLIICLSEEMPSRLEHVLLSGGEAASSSASTGADRPRAAKYREGQEHIRHRTSRQKPHAVPGEKPAAGLKAWLQHWLQLDSQGPQDARDSPRKPGTGFTASFWTGGGPQVYEIRDVSDTGLYVVTDERWYPGTQVRITLTMPDAKSPNGHRSLVVEAKAVRWGNDGVGLEFVL